MPYIVSVLMVVKDDRWLDEALWSLVAQTYDSLEVVCLRDGGDGLTVGLNRAARLARSPRYLARLDADDLAYPGRIARQVAYLDANPDVVVCGTWAHRADAHGHLVGTSKPDPAWLPWRNPLIHSSVLMRRDAFETSGGYDETLATCQDFDLWVRLLGMGRVAIIPEPWVIVREHAGQVSRRSWRRRWAQHCIRRRYARI